MKDAIGSCRARLRTEFNKRREELRVSVFFPGVRAGMAEGRGRNERFAESVGAFFLAGEIGLAVEAAERRGTERIDAERAGTVRPRL